MDGGASYRIKRGVADVFKYVVRSLQGAVLAPAGRHRTRLQIELSEDMVPVVEVALDGASSAAIRFFCPSATALWRAETLLSKEPDTIEWIDGFGPEDVLWDIGANLGVYSLYAAKRARARVLAFEPSAGNYWLLNKNIYLNRLDGLVTAYCLALSRQTSLGTFNMPDTDLGGALYAFGDVEGTIRSPDDTVRKVVFHQGGVGFSIDEFAKKFCPPRPTRVKIDVDGGESDILRGGLETLSDQRMQSISVELDESSPAHVQAATEVLATCGLRLQRKTQARTADEASRYIFNYLFVR